MNVKNAVDNLGELLNVYSRKIENGEESYIDYYQAITVAIDCAEKQMPKDVVYVVYFYSDTGDHGGTEIACPSCGAIFEQQDIGNAYCLNCGQRLRWTNKVCEVE